MRQPGPGRVPAEPPVAPEPSSMWMMRVAEPETKTRTTRFNPFGRTQEPARPWTSKMMSAAFSTDPQVAFRPIRLSSHWGAEEAWLGLVDDQLVSILVRAGDQASKDEGSWYLEVGFGSCQGEGRLFPSLDAAARWIGDRIRRDGL